LLVGTTLAHTLLLLLPLLLFRFDAKGMAGNIIHAIATTNAIVGGLIVVEALKLLAGEGLAHDSVVAVLVLSNALCCVWHCGGGSQAAGRWESGTFKSKMSCVTGYSYWWRTVQADTGLCPYIIAGSLLAGESLAHDDDCVVASYHSSIVLHRSSHALPPVTNST
jgi:hypothetical protein